MAFEAQGTSTVWTSVLRCWDADVFLPSLSLSFITASVQLLGYYSDWARSALVEAPGVGWDTQLAAARYTHDSGCCQCADFDNVIVAIFVQRKTFLGCSQCPVIPSIGDVIRYECDRNTGL